MKQRGKVEPSHKSLAPTKRGLWHSAVEKLHEAHAAIRIMETANDRVTYESGWIRFVESLEECWTSFFDEGTKVSTKFQPWAGRILAERKADELLQYLYQARHQSQHGRISLEWSAATMQVAPGYSGCIKNLQVFSDGSFEVDATPSGNTNNQLKLVVKHGDARLPVINNKKHNQVYQPPSKHQGQDVRAHSPIDIAKLGAQYYEDIVKEAMQRFTADE